MSAVHLFGIRHHGPGSARSMLQEFERLQPDVVLVEGPPDANELLSLVGHDELVPPVALLIHDRDDDGRAVFYPFADYSPEWNAIRWANRRAIPVRFIDLPMAQRWALPAESEEVERVEDPLSMLAHAAGHGDAERWWDRLVETRRTADSPVFSAVHSMLVEVRAEAPATGVEALREAWMRRGLRTAIAEGYQRIAVVCGAWHTPALANLPPASHDDKLLRGLGKVRTAAAWIPWSYENLTLRSGYGAGVESPMWYETLWRDHTDPGAPWMTRAARLLRDRDLPVSSAHVIEACRLADSLAALRQHPLPGSVDFQDAAVAVLGGGSAVPLAVIHTSWHCDHRLGRVPEDAPASPLLADLAVQQKRLRLTPKDEEVVLTLDLREPMARERSVLLRRLRILDVEWGRPTSSETRSRGTFREVWALRWRPEFAVALINHSARGHTIERAARARVARSSAEISDLAELVRLFHESLLADLPEAVSALADAIRDRSAVSNDVLQLLRALPGLVQLRHLGDVRESDVQQVDEILHSMLPRILVGLPLAVTGINSDAAHGLLSEVQAGSRAITTLGVDDVTSGWLSMWQKISAHDAAHPCMRGYGERVLHDSGRHTPESLGASVHLALSRGQTAMTAAEWVEGFLAGSGSLLVHDDALRDALDNWLGSVTDEAFVDVLPLLRRTFAGFTQPERRSIGERLRARSGPRAERPSDTGDLDRQAAARVLPVLKLIWGIEDVP